MRKTSLPKVAILYPPSIPWVARCVDGIREFSNERGGWQLVTSPPDIHGVGESPLTVRSLEGWQGDGVIVATNDLEELERVRRLGLPAVNLAGGLDCGHGVPRVLVDNRAAGRLAAEHLIERGLRRLAFYGWSGFTYSEDRCRGFREVAENAGIETSVMLQRPGLDREYSWNMRIAGPARWLASLEKPCGIFAVHDHRAQTVMAACEEEGFRIPEDIAIIGMDNDEVTCEHSVPTLTSVSRSSTTVGRQAAEVIDRMIRTGKSVTGDHLVPPRGVIARQSTDYFYIEDPVTARAVELMRSGLQSDLNIVHIADQTGVSKRTLEYHFRRSLGTSPRRYLSHLKVERAREILREHPDWTLSKVARASGFQTVATLHACFRRITGDPPSKSR